MRSNKTKGAERKSQIKMGSRTKERRKQNRQQGSGRTPRNAEWQKVKEKWKKWERAAEWERWREARETISNVSSASVAWPWYALKTAFQLGFRSLYSPAFNLCCSLHSAITTQGKRRRERRTRSAARSWNPCGCEPEKWQIHHTKGLKCPMHQFPGTIPYYVGDQRVYRVTKSVLFWHLKATCGRLCSQTNTDYE